MPSTKRRKLLIGLQEVQRILICCSLLKAGLGFWTKYSLKNKFESRELKDITDKMTEPNSELIEISLNTNV